MSKIKVSDYSDCFIVSVDDKEYVFNGMLEADKMVKLLKELGFKSKYKKTAKDVKRIGAKYE